MSVKSILMNFNIWAFVLAFIMSFFIPKGNGGWKGWIHALMRSYFFWVLGALGLWNFICHVFLGGYTANIMQWPQSPFQYEVGIANLVFCVLGFLCFFQVSRPFQLASLIGFFVWYEGDAIGHFIRIYVRHTSTFSAMGSYFTTDLILPILGFFIFWLSKPGSGSSEMHSGDSHSHQIHSDDSHPPV